MPAVAVSAVGDIGSDKLSLNVNQPEGPAPKSKLIPDFERPNSVNQPANALVPDLWCCSWAVVALTVTP